jgi:hypothetical protein
VGGLSAGTVLLFPGLPLVVAAETGVVEGGKKGKVMEGI